MHLFSMFVHFCFLKVDQPIPSMKVIDVRLFELPGQLLEQGTYRVDERISEDADMKATRVHTYPAALFGAVLHRFVVECTGSELMAVSTRVNVPFHVGQSDRLLYKM